jgi:hypothetical protein
LRWLAVPDSGLLILGTTASVQEELDRHLTGTPPEQWLLQKLAHFDHRDLTWSIVRKFDRYDEMHPALGSLDPTFASLLQNADAFQFGIRYDRWVWFEFEVTSLSRATTDESSALPFRLSIDQENVTPSPVLSSNLGRGNIRGVIRLSKAQFERWLADSFVRSFRR